MTAAIYQCGDTIQVTEPFYSFAGILANLAAPPSVKVLQADKVTQVGATLTSTNVGTGLYACAVTLPATYGAPTGDPTKVVWPTQPSVVEPSPI